jgi:hypothetical protein
MYSTLVTDLAEFFYSSSAYVQRFEFGDGNGYGSRFVDGNGFGNGNGYGYKYTGESGDGEGVSIDPEISTITSEYGPESRNDIYQLE